MVFAAGWGKLLLVIHALAAMLLLATLAHILAFAWPYLWGRPGRERAERRFTAIALLAFAVTFSTGALAYPNYRVNVRAAHLDNDAPHISRLFDLKENWATLGLPMAAALWWMRRRLRPRQETTKARLYWTIAALLTGLVAFNVVAGLLVVSHGGI